VIPRPAALRVAAARLAAALAVITVLGGATAACGSGHPAAKATATANSSTRASIPVTLLADPGLPSHVGAGPLSAPVATQLMQYFEDHVAQAYAANNADSLYGVLAGPMLTGNRATINLLASQHRRNVLHVAVDTVTIDTADKTRTVLDMNGQLTNNRFFDTTTGQPLVGGTSQGGPVNFQVFLDYNPNNNTWYWTGEQDLNKSASAASPSPAPSAQPGSG